MKIINTVVSDAVKKERIYSESVGARAGVAGTIRNAVI